MANRRRGPLARADVVAVSGEAHDLESPLHAEISAFCKVNMWLPLHGSMAHRTHRTVGEPDFVVAVGEGVTVWAEAKSKTGKLSDAQQALKAWLAKLGITLYEIRTVAEFANAVNVELEKERRKCQPAGS